MGRRSIDLDRDLSSGLRGAAERRQRARAPGRTGDRRSQRGRDATARSRRCAARRSGAAAARARYASAAQRPDVRRDQARLPRHLPPAKAPARSAAPATLTTVRSSLCPMIDAVPVPPAELVARIGGTPDQYSGVRPMAASPPRVPATRGLVLRGQVSTRFRLWAWSHSVRVCGGSGTRGLRRLRHRSRGDCLGERSPIPAVQFSRLSRSAPAAAARPAVRSRIWDVGLLPHHGPVEQLAGRAPSRVATRSDCRLQRARPGGGLAGIWNRMG